MLTIFASRSANRIPASPHRTVAEHVKPVTQLLTATNMLFGELRIGVFEAIHRRRLGSARLKGANEPLRRDGECKFTSNPA